MSNYPHLRPGHPVHGNQRRWIRSAKKREQMRQEMNRLFNQIRKQQPTVKGLDKFTKGEAANG